MTIAESRNQMRFDSVGSALWEERDAVASARPTLERLAACVGRASDMDPAQYSQLFAITTRFRPDLIIEIGRLAGNSTCVLTEAANRLGHCRVFSVCLTDKWQRETLPKLQGQVAPDWFQKLDARVSNVADIDFRPIVATADRVLVFFDAHGWEVGEYLLAEILPLLETKQHLVLVHDMFDYRYHPELREYAGLGIWRGHLGPHAPEHHVFVGPIASTFEEGLAIVDFALRNGIELHTAEHEIRTEIDDQPDRRREMVRLLGEEWYSPRSTFLWFTLASAPPGTQLTYPVFQRENVPSRRAQLGEQIAWDLYRFNIGGKPSPVTFALILAKLLGRRYPL